jgi:precorrin-3B synthase
LSGRDSAGLLDVRPLVGALDRGLQNASEFADLPGRFLFALDDGRGDVAALHPDIGLVGIARNRLTLLLSGEDSELRVAPGAAVELMLAAARAFLSERAIQGTRAWRLAELKHGPTRIAASLASAHLPSVTHSPSYSLSIKELVVEPPAYRANNSLIDSTDRAQSPEPQPWQEQEPTPQRGQKPERRPRGPIGLVPQQDGRVALATAAPFGRLTGAQAQILAEASPALLVLTPWRGVVVPDLARVDAAGWATALSSHGLVLDPGSPWLNVTACTGRPGCAKSLADVRAEANRVVALSALATAGTRSASDLPVHWVGCERRCGRPAGRVVEVLATGMGYRVSIDGQTWSAEDPAVAVEQARRGT